MEKEEKELYTPVKCIILFIFRILNYFIYYWCSLVRMPSEEKNKYLTRLAYFTEQIVYNILTPHKFLNETSFNTLTNYFM